MAVPLPVPAVAATTAVFDAVGELGRARGIRWVQAEGLHLTIRFLGAAPQDAVPPIADAVRAVAASTDPFDVILHGAGAFPSVDRPRVLFLAITEGGDALRQVAESLDDRLEGAGWSRPARPFRPHLTVARTDAAPYDAGSAAARALTVAGSATTIRFPAERLVLFRSHLGRGPARYQPLAEGRFGA